MKRYEELAKKAGAKEYIITKKTESSAELFFVKKNLDMRRMKDVEKIEIFVYKEMEKDGKKTKGGSGVSVNSGMSDDEIVKRIKSALYSTEFSQNPYYELPSKCVSDEVCVESDLNEYSLSQIADKFVEAFFEEDNDDKAFANSFELFVTEDKVRIITSHGTDVSYKTRTVKGEFVAQCKEPQDVETYQNFEYDAMALSDFKALVKRTLKMTADRAVAKNMPKTGDYDVIISDRYMEDFIGFFGERAHAAYIYQKYSDYEIGKQVQGEDIEGDKLNVTFVPREPFSESGILMKERPFLEDGVLKLIHGSTRFMYYLGLEQVGTYQKAVLPAGTLPFDEMINRPCLHVVNFSDFQMDALDGHFGGEIRLAYLYDGKGNVECVTGGSINGDMFEAQRNLRFSEETQNLANYVGPKAVLVKNISLAGE